MLISVKIHILYPNCKEQEIHRDKYEDPIGKFENGITTQGKLLIITIHTTHTHTYIHIYICILFIIRINCV